MFFSFLNGIECFFVGFNHEQMVLSWDFMGLNQQQMVIS
jgi:hypothetical protein